MAEYLFLSFFLCFFSLCLKDTKAITMHYKAEELNFRPIYARLFVKVSSFGQLQIYVKLNFCPMNDFVIVKMQDVSQRTKLVLHTN